MASTYVNDLRLEEMATGDQSGTWGETTNTNLELISEAFSFGTEAITTNADTHTTSIADGATDPGRSMYLKYTGTLDSACTITIGPNTVSKMWFIENGTSGSQNIIISQGSGANITIPPGDVKVVYSDGAGSGAAVVDAFASLSVVDLKVQDDLTVTDDMTVGGTLGVTGALTVGTSANDLGTTAGDQLTPLTLRSDTSNTDSLLFTTERLSDGSDWTTAAHRIQRKVDATKMGYIQLGNSGGDLITFGKNASEYMRLDGTGQLGLGTDSPDTLMEIVGADPVLTIRDTATGIANANATLRLAESGGSSSLGGYFDVAMTGQNLTFGHSTDGSADSEQMRLEGSTGDFAIGITAASGRLHVNKNGTAQIIALFSSDLGTNDRNMQILSPASDSASAPFEFSTSNSFQFTIDGGAALNIASDKNVGIGTASPSRELELSAANPRFRITDTDGGYAEISGNGGHLSFAADVGGTQSGTRIAFDVDGGEIARFNSSGKLGIGTTTIPAKLTVSAASATGGILLQDSNTTSAAPTIQVIGQRSDGNISQSFSGGLALAQNQTNAKGNDNKKLGTVYFGINHTDGTAANIAYSASISAELSGDANSATDMPTDLCFYTGSTGRDLGTANQTYGSEALRIAASGRTGILNTDPNAQLHIGDANAEGNATNPALQIGGTTSYRLGLYTQAERGVIDCPNGDDGLDFRVKTAGLAMRVLAATGGILVKGTSAFGTSAGTANDITVGMTGTNTTGIKFDTASTAVSGNARVYLVENKAGDRLAFSTGAGTEIFSAFHEGNVSIGSTTGTRKLTVLGSSTSQGTIYAYTNAVHTGTDTNAHVSIRSDNASASGDVLHIRGDGSGNLLTVEKSGTSQLKVDYEGNVLIGKPTHDQNNTQGVDITNTGAVVATNDEGISFLANRTGSDGQTFLFRRQNVTVGSISVTGSATTYATSSDYRLKENVDYDFTALDRVAQLKPARFNFIATPTVTVDGFVAHEVQDVVPEAIIGEKDAVDNEGNPDYQGIDQSKLVPLLTKAIQEQQTIIDDLKSRIEALEA